MKSMESYLLSHKIDYFTESAINTHISVPRIKTGFDQVDKMLGGGLTPGLIVLGAASSLGKSTFMLQLAENISAEGTPVLFFSLEMMSNMIAAKALNRQIFVDSEKTTLQYSAMKLTDSEAITQFSSDTWRDIDKSRKTLRERSANLYILDMESLTMDEATATGIYDIVKDFIDGQEDAKKPLVIIDYLQILKADPKDTKSDRQSIENCIRWMSKMHLEFHIPVMLVSSLSRSSYKQKVQQDSFKETGDIEYSADVLLGLSFSSAPGENSDSKNKFDLTAEKAKSPREVELSFLKQRYGMCGTDSTVKFHYYAQYDYFEEQAVKTTKPSRRVSPKSSSANPQPAVTTESTTATRKIGSGQFPTGAKL